MKKNCVRNGFTLVELMIVVAILATIAAILATIAAAFSAFFINNRGFTEKRAYEGADLFISTNNIVIQRRTCAGDSDGDGYSTCTITPVKGDQIFLQCPVSWFDRLMGATSCKEVPMAIFLQQRIQQSK